MLLDRVVAWSGWGFAKAIVALGLLLTILAACSFAPVYGDRAQADKRYTLRFEEPSSRLQQIVYQDLIKSFGNSNSPQALLVTVNVSGSNLDANQGSQSLDGRLRIFRPDPTGVQDPQRLYQTTRTVTVTKASSPQSLANQVNNVEVTEQAAHELAQSLRVTLLSVLAVMDRNGVLDQPYGAEITTEIVLPETLSQ